MPRAVRLWASESVLQVAGSPAEARQPGAAGLAERPVLTLALPGPPDPLQGGHYDSSGPAADGGPCAHQRGTAFLTRCITPLAWCPLPPGHHPQPSPLLPKEANTASPGGAKTFCFSPSCRSASRMAGVPGSAEPPFPHWARKSRRWWLLVCRRGGGTAQEGSLSLQGSSEHPGNTAYPPAGASRPRACRRPPAFLRLSRCFSLEVICKAARRMWSGGPS